MFPMIHGILAGGGGVELDADYAIYEAAMTTPPGGTWQTAVNQLFIDLKAALGVSALSDAWDVAYFLAAETEQASRLNMVKRSHDCTATAAPQFTFRLGVNGNGTSQFLNTNYNANTQGVRYTLDSASFGIYSRTALSSSAFVDMGWISGAQVCYMQTRNVGGSMAVAINRNGQTTGAVTNSQGLFVCNRSGSTDAQGYRNGTQVATDASGSTSIANNNMYICAWNNAGAAGAFTTRQYTFAFAGRSMNSTEQADVYTAVQAAMVAIGASV